MHRPPDLAADPTGATPPSSEHRQSLLQAFGIDGADLQANRVGALGPRQAREIRRSGVRNLLAAFAGGVILALILFFVADRPLVPAQFITAGVLFAALLATGLFDFVRTRRAAAEGRVTMLRGPIQVQSRGTQGWHLDVAGESFRVPVQPWSLQSGEAYRVYVVDGARRIVGMEPDDGV